MSEEELWYPAFGLKEDPFQSYDYRNEIRLDELVPYIKTKAIKFITELTESRKTCGIVGDRGVGKSTVLHLAKDNIIERKKFPPEWLYVFCSPGSTVEFYNALFDKLIPRVEYEYDEDAIKEILDHRIEKGSWFGYGSRESVVGGRITKSREPTHLYCRYPGCKRGTPRCELPLGGRKDPSLVNTVKVVRGLNNIDHYCPLKMFLIKEFLLHKARGTDYLRFLIDLPDDLAKAEEFMRLVRVMQDAGSVILIGIREHQRRLQKFDMFARYPFYEFPLMTNEELKELYYARTKWQQKEKAPPPFTKKALEHIVKQSVRNPRTLIQTCSKLLVDANLKGISKPIRLDFVEKSGAVPHMTFDKAIEGLLEKYVDMKRVWVPVGESVRHMKEWFNMDVKSRSLGRRLMRLMKEKGLPIAHRYNPTSEFRYTGEAEN